MGLAAFNRAREAAKAMATRKTLVAEPKNESLPVGLLSRLNSAEVGADLADIPTIGKGAGKVIIESRPEPGYKTLKEAITLNEKVTKSPYSVDWNAVSAHFED